MTLIQSILLLLSLLNLANCLESVEEQCRDMPTGFRLPHPEKCSVYLECTKNDNNESHALMFSCDNGIYFNPTKLKCDSKYFSEKCKKNKLPLITTTTQTTPTPTPTPTPTTIPPTTTEENFPITTTTTTTTTTSPPATTTLDPRIITCPIVDSEQVLFIKSIDDCSKYFMCYHGQPLPLKCWNGLHWNDEMKKCTPSEISQCDANLFPYPQCPTQGNAFLPHPENCQYFLYCLNGIKTIQRCGLFDSWDINEKKCKRKARAICYSDVKEKAKK